MIKGWFFIVLIVFSCKPADQNAKSSFVFLSMEKTKCMGKCPAYKVDFYTDGKMIYTGTNNVPNLGQKILQLKKSDLTSIKENAEALGFFKLEDKYMAEVTDLPTVILVYNDGKKEKKIIDYYNAPKKLKEFEEKLETIVYSYLK